jgi:hypothetical protein
MKAKTFFITFLLFTSASVFAQKTQTFLIIDAHTVAECMASMDQLRAKGNDFLGNVYWGCHTGDHTAYMIVEAENEAAAKNMLPEAARDHAKVIAVEKFTVEQIEAMHKPGK